MKLPSDAFDFYFALGVARSYRLVAKQFDVSKTTVAKRAKKEGWQARIEALMAKARDAQDEKALESIEAMNEQHLKILRLVRGKAIEALRAMPLSSGMEAVRALEMTIKQERLVRGEPSERTALSIEETIRREFDRWVEVEEEVEEAKDDDGKSA